MKSFEIGDRVVAIENVDYAPVKGRTGTVVKLMDGRGGYDVGVAYDNLPEFFDSGHDCDGCCENGYGWYGKFENFEFAEEEVPDNLYTAADIDAILSS